MSITSFKQKRVYKQIYFKPSNFINQPSSLAVLAYFQSIQLLYIYEDCIGVKLILA